ncbi:MAG: thiamine-phosphate kinase [Candidatus Solibacter usitatus]|nr:thiamine-phosphate kinase [Candidatus Solibacter usitatus]
MPPRGSSEFEVLQRLAGLVRTPHASPLVLGIGDDCAAYRSSREDLLFTTDMLIEDVHFRRDTHSAEAAGRKALVRGLSDIAAMGGEPRFCLLSLAVPEWADKKWTDGFWRGFLRLAAETGTALAGGDLARAARLYCDVTVCGAVPKGKAVLRSGARPGDRIYVSGALGGSALGLAAGKGPAWKRHLAPEPRLALGKFLRERLRATAMMDLSDGLSIDLHRMCRASMLAAEIHAPPRFPKATLEQALHGGEDYELLFTLKPGVAAPQEFQGVPLTEIGIMRPGKPGLVKLDRRPLEPLGFDHFRPS